MYGTAFFDVIRDGTVASARVVVPLVMTHIGPRTVLDVGCGEGWWAQTFADHGGCEVLGLDGGPRPAASPLGDRYIRHDLRESFGAMARVDLAVCLEVAEHLPEGRADGLVDDLTTVAPTVLFSAAIPGQGGTGHINEQWPSYWVERFRARGYAVSGALRWHIWGHRDVENWYRQNLLVAAREPEAYPDLFNTPMAEPWPVVHPVLYEARRRA